jgi:Ca-activated chloride channel homolog
VRMRSAAAAIGWLALAAWPHGQVFRSAVDMASFGVTVVDKKGDLAMGLGRDDFEIVEDGVTQSMSLFARGDQPESPIDLHLGLLFDMSGSMEESIGFSRSAAIKFLNAVPDAKDITLVAVDTEVQVTRYGQNDFARLVERIRRKKPDGMTALYDAVGVYLDGAQNEEGRRVLVLYTDGGDTNSTLNYTEIQDLLRASDVTLYSIGFLANLSQSSQMDQRMRLRTLAEITGGEAFFPTVLKDLDATYARVLTQIRAQYTVGYVSTNTRTDGAWRKVEIRVKTPGMKARTRRGYFAPFRKRP